MSVIRAFIAVNLSPEILEQIRDISGEMQKQLQGIPIRWVPVENIHLTLKFLGDVSIANLELLEKILQRVGRSHHCCEIRVGGLGAYPKIQRPRVIWIGLQVPQELLSLHRDIEVESGKLGYVNDARPFSPHLTIGRVARNSTLRDLQALVEILQGYKVGYLGVIHIKEVTLYRSDLKTGGAVYTRIFSAPLLEENSGMKN